MVTLLTRNLWRKLRGTSAFTTVVVKISKTKTERLTVGKKSARNSIYFVTSWLFFKSKTDVSFGFEADVVVALGLKEEINLLAASTTRVYIWHFRWKKCMATVGTAIVCDYKYGNSSLCDLLRSAIYDPRPSAIVCDHMETSLKWN